MPTSIALLDGGFDLSHPGLQHLDNKGRKWWVARPDFLFSTSGKDPVTETMPEGKPHGTHMSSLLSGKSSPKGTPNRFAPEKVVLHLVKTTADDAEPFTEWFLKGLATAVQLQVDVVAVAYFPDWQGKPQEAQVKSAFAALHNAGILLVAPLSNAHGFTDNDTLRFPANMPNTIVCGVPKDSILQNWGSKQVIDARIDFLLPQAPVIICPPGDGACVSNTMNSSLSVAVVAGLIAKQIQTWKTAEGSRYRRRTHDEMVAALRKKAIPFAAAKMLKDESIQLYFPPAKA